MVLGYTIVCYCCVAHAETYRVAAVQVLPPESCGVKVMPFGLLLAVAYMAFLTSGKLTH